MMLSCQRPLLARRSVGSTSKQPPTGKDKFKFPSLEDLTARYGVLTDTATTEPPTGRDNFDVVEAMYVHRGHPRYQISPAMVAILGTLLYPDGQLVSSESGEALEHAALLAVQTAVMACRGLGVASRSEDFTQKFDARLHRALQEVGGPENGHRHRQWAASAVCRRDPGRAAAVHQLGCWVQCDLVIPSTSSTVVRIASHYFEPNALTCLSHTTTQTQYG
eukprot:PhM_4_TR18022/c1_g5_i15/m.93181